MAKQVYNLCKRHVQRLIHEEEITSDARKTSDGRKSQWLDHVYRLFYYDAAPYDGIGHNPISNRQIKFSETKEAKFRNELFGELRRLRKFALRLGKVNRETDWTISNPALRKQLLRTRNHVGVLEKALAQAGGVQLTAAENQQLTSVIDLWKSLQESDVRLGLKQKGVDMRIGIDIATMTPKKQVDTIILVTGDSDFVPAAKVARREGVEFIVDPLWQQVNDDLNEHVDGVVSPLRRRSK